VIRIRLAEGRDAKQILRLIRACYGETYVEQEWLDSDRLVRSLEVGSTVYALAEDGGELVGQIALERVNPQLWLHCRAVVSLSHRGRGLLYTMSEPLLGEVARSKGAQLILGSSVTHHTHTQRFNVRAGFVPLGLLLGIYPGIRPAGPDRVPDVVSGVLMGLPCESKWETRTTRLPGLLAEQVEQRLAALGIPCSKLPAGETPTAPLRALVSRHGPSGRVHLQFSSRGRADPLSPTWLEAERRVGARVFWADVPLSLLESFATAERLLALGFSFSAAIPLAGPAGEDIVRLQRCEDPLPRDDLRSLPVLSGLVSQIYEEHETARALPVRPRS
jgi:hypothetical protein